MKSPFRSRLASGSKLFFIPRFSTGLAVGILEKLYYTPYISVNDSVTDIPSIPGELFAKFQTSFYSDPVHAVFKALGVD